jgi:two-component system phosphate regulon sensor histidine kinase PhoR
MISSPGSLRARLFLAFSIITLIAALLPALLARNVLYNDRMALAGQEALAQTALAKSMFDAAPSEAQVDALFNTSRALSYRMTVTDASGTVTRDSHIDAPKLTELDNHKDRPEIEEARAKGQGIPLRHSNSLGLDAVYAAVSLQNGGILRVAVPSAVIKNSLETEFSYLGMVVVCVVIFCLLLSAFITAQVQKAANSMAEVLASIPRDGCYRRLREVPGKEFLPLAYTVNAMADTIEESVRTMLDQQAQLESILESMNEGVLVLTPFRQYQAME